MKEQDIIDYVLKTPHNTNPEVLKGLLQKFKKNGEEEVDDYVATVPPSTIKTYINTSSLGIHTSAFEGFTELETVDIPNVWIIDAKAFKSCRRLISVNTEHLIYVGYEAFGNCSSLRECKIVFYNYFSNSISGTAMDVSPTCDFRAFANCANLERVYIFGLPTIPGACFIDCVSLNALIITDDVRVLELYDDSVLRGTKIESGNGYIYVPSKFFSDYQSDASWSRYSNQFRVLEDYTVDGTIDGELDETKI